MFMLMNSKDNRANGGTTEQTRNSNERARQAEERVNEQPDKQTDSCMMELTIKIRKKLV